jgi:hypothetical protein
MKPWSKYAKSKNRGLAMYGQVRSSSRTPITERLYSDLMTFLRTYQRRQNSSPNDFNMVVAKVLGCSIEASHAMKTQRVNSPRYLPVLPLYVFHLGLTPSEYVSAAPIFDVYTSRILLLLHDDNLYSYLTSRAFSELKGALASHSLNADNALGWQIVRSLAPALTIENVVALVCDDFHPMDFLSLWVTGVGVQMAVRMLLEGIDLSLATSLIESMDTPMRVFADAPTYVEWTEYDEVHEFPKRYGEYVRAWQSSVK